MKRTRLGMKLKTLLKEVEVEQVKGSRDVEITGICSNSNLVAPGNLFVAKKGRNSDGSLYIADAIAAGAHAILTDIFDPTYKEVVQVIAKDVIALEGLLAAKFHGFPSEKLFTVGITGTNGKTTTATFVKHLFDSIEKPCGLLGTIEYIVGNHRYDATLTTSEVTVNHKLLKEMVQQGCQAAVMEVSSHGLDQGRVNQIDFDAAIFTNLSQDHLDYHKTMEEYCQAKRKLFLQLEDKAVAIVNGDDPFKYKILEGCKAKTITYGFDKGNDVRGELISSNSFKVYYGDESTEITWQLIGRHNVSNGLAAIALGISYGLSLEKIREIMSLAPVTRGRLQPVPNPLGIELLVDFAHTPDALNQVLKSLREMSEGRLITVFGCGGMRDAGKRPQMGSVAEQFSDHTIITSDNPRTEEPAKIIDDIAKGFADKTHYTVVEDRKEAIGKAISMADSGDTVLIAGKGHEKRQIFAHQTIEFDDFEVAKQWCEK